MERRKLKYPRKRVIITNGYAKDIHPIIDFAETYKRSEKAGVIVKEYSLTSLWLNGKQIPKVSVTFYSYEPVGILRENFSVMIHESDMHGRFVIEGWPFSKR